MSFRAESRRLYKPEEVAVILGRAPDLIRADLRAGRIRGRKVGKGRGHWRIPATEVDRLKRQKE